MDKQAIYADFRQALIKFKEALAMPADNDVFKAGCIQYFEFTFELAWKTIKKVAEDEGILDCNSPKAALKAAFSNRWIDEEDIWLDMLTSRNKMSHTYKAAEALKVFSKLPSYAVAFENLEKEIGYMV